MAAYIIARISVSDSAAYAEYARRTPAIAEAYGGRFLVKGGAAEYLEGAGPERHVVIEFDDTAAARRFYDSPEYRAVLPIALANSERDMVLVEGA